MKKALIVGINNYPNAPLCGCVNDAKEVAKVLATNEDGSPNFENKLTTSETDVINKANLKGSIKALFEGNCEKALLYFSGHGFIDSTGGYLVTPDYENNDEGISMDYILNLANQSKVKDKIILLDCCHSGAFGTPAVSGNFASQLAEGVSVLTASRDSESAIEINGHGVFTSLVIAALQGGAADLRGYITPGSIYAYVDQALGSWDQRPIFKANVSRLTSLRTINPPIAPDILRKIILYFPLPESEHALDPSYEDTTTSPCKSNVQKFKHLQKLESVGLVVPIGEEHMYYAAMNSKACKLTTPGHLYWKLAKEKRI